MIRRFTVCSLVAVMALALVPQPASAASKEIQELQRDLAALQEQVRLLKESQDKQLSAIMVLVQQSLDSSSKSNTGVAVIQSSLQQSLKDLESKVVTPVAGLSTRLDGMDQDVRALQQAVTDLAGMISKMQQGIADLNKTVSILQTPAPPPPAAAGSATGGGAAPAVADSPCPPATQLYADANRDKSGAKYDLALKEYADYLRCYGNQDFAPNAQYYIGTIHASQGDYEQAVKDFDVVLEKYSDNNKTPDSLYSKGLALQKLGRMTDGASEFAELIRRFPGSDLATKACEQRRAVGLNCPITKPAARAPAKGKKKE